MPTVLRVGPYRFFFYSGDRLEPPHVHVESGNGEAKLWLDPVESDHSDGYGDAELHRVIRIVLEHQEELLRAWNGYFGD